MIRKVAKYNKATEEYNKAVSDYQTAQEQYAKDKLEYDTAVNFLQRQIMNTIQ